MNSNQQQELFLSVIEQNKGIIYKIANSFKKDEDDRKDLTQEIIFQLWRAFPAYDQRSKLSTWMYRVCLNTAITYFKKDSKRSKSTFSLNGEEHYLRNEESCLEVENQISYLYKAIHELNDIEKALIFLYLEGFSHLDIGTNLGISEGNARVKLNRTKNKLQEIIKRNGYEF